MAQVGWAAEVDGGRCTQETVGSRFREQDVKTVSEDEFQFGEARIVCGNKGAGVGSWMGGVTCWHENRGHRKFTWL